jgi:hypothetical protein
LECRKILLQVNLTVSNEIHRISSSGKHDLELEVFTQRRVLNIRASPEENNPRFSIRVVCAEMRVLAPACLFVRKSPFAHLKMNHVNLLLGLHLWPTCQFHPAERASDMIGLVGAA